MMLQKALKMDNTDIMYDMIHDLKFMESNFKMVEIPYSNPDIAAAIASQMPGVLTMVIHISYIVSVFQYIHSS